MDKVNNSLQHWYIFYKDQLLLQKQGNRYIIPLCSESPVDVEHILPVEMFGRDRYFSTDGTSGLL